MTSLSAQEVAGDTQETTKYFQYDILCSKPQVYLALQTTVCRFSEACKSRIIDQNIATFLDFNDTNLITLLRD